MHANGEPEVSHGNESNMPTTGRSVARFRWLLGMITLTVASLALCTSVAMHVATLRQAAAPWPDWIDAAMIFLIFATFIPAMLLVTLLVWHDPYFGYERLVKLSPVYLTAAIYALPPYWIFVCVAFLFEKLPVNPAVASHFVLSCGWSLAFIGVIRLLVIAKRAEAQWPRCKNGHVGGLRGTICKFCGNVFR